MITVVILGNRYLHDMITGNHGTDSGSPKIQIYIYIYIYTYVHTYIYIYIYVYTHEIAIYRMVRVHKYR